jgi:murein DD-endopeptidase MepM/ murein hydrolase activator NlpD
MRHATPHKSNTRHMAQPIQNVFWLKLLAKKPPRSHLLATISVTAILTIALTIFPSERVAAKRASTTITLPSNQTHIKEDSVSAIGSTLQPTAIEEDSIAWNTVVVKSGDNLSTLFPRASLGATAVHNFYTSNKETKQLERIKPGETLNFGVDKNGQLQKLTYIKSQLESWQFNRSDNKYSAKHVIREPELMPTYLEAEITDSLFVDADKVGMPHGLIMELAGIFGWDVDFALDIRKGDSFTVLYNERFVDGTRIDTGNILAAEFTNQGKTFRTVRHVDSNGAANYFTPEGRSMRKAFLRAPVNFSRVSSGFDMRRSHPVTGKVRPHRGIDYAAPRGTPIYAAGDGKVVRAGFTNANGNYAVIEHGTQYSTKYLHMTKRYAKKGQTVKQGSTIGTVGSTGLATGPHLHYEFLVNGVHRNPRTVKFPVAKPIAKNQMANFKAQTAPLMASLEANKSNYLLARSKAKDNLSNEG